MLTIFLQCRGSAPVDYILTILVVVVDYLGGDCTYGSRKILRLAIILGAAAPALTFLSFSTPTACTTAKTTPALAPSPYATSTLTRSPWRVLAAASILPFSPVATTTISTT